MTCGVADEIQRLRCEVWLFVCTEHDFQIWMSRRIGTAPKSAFFKFQTPFVKIILFSSARESLVIQVFVFICVRREPLPTAPSRTSKCDIVSAQRSESLKLSLTSGTHFSEWSQSDSSKLGNHLSCTDKQ